LSRLDRTLLLCLSRLGRTLLLRGRQAIDVPAGPVCGGYDLVTVGVS
jgi:hypothetical protein